ncbi:lipopolysaccharide transport system ATP-binding protein [Novimethylophilus kurashikiensis]|uniref:Lipopolysaccharide transport system ATP-binding protein n=1 Tax=Novimethylophilus kurashikiensis TaxID=1825523 RepID=A0A2R5F9H8_9PROT|nr:ABC transporter ATP-binding protein [Novimethylophilus kurashikiensis]GBG13294.1 lipopolysaccharide transport system ATP-binding protein [Novimethylophilus kurashikiensis]
MTKIVIEVADIGKQFKRPVALQANTLRDAIAYKWHNWLKKLTNRPATHTQEDSFWALREINFQVREGEVVGLIGRNGAGKSTLLKILSRISMPTEGQIRMHGRVGSLLEVGTGFHPELTGKENVYLNGAILGLTRNEINKKFDAILDFSGVEEFIDTPVKHYSSGMQARLGFAVAAHLEPEILIVDEVLAVGDAAFQKKCLGKMRDAAGEGRTVLYVSHNLASLNTFCTRGIVLDHGKVSFDGDIDKAVTHYLKGIFPLEKGTDGFSQRSIDGFKIITVKIRDSNNHDTPVMRHGEESALHFHFENKLSSAPHGLVIGILVTNEIGIDVINVNSIMTGATLAPLPSAGEIVFQLGRIGLLPGNYYITFTVNSSDGVVCQIYSGLSITVADGDFYGSGKGCLTTRAIYMPECSWSIRNEEICAS